MAFIKALLIAGLLTLGLLGILFVIAYIIPIIIFLVIFYIAYVIIKEKTKVNGPPI